MASVELPAQQVRAELVARGVNDVVVAVVASPQSTVIGGATETVRDLVAAWEQREVMAREVAVDVASHSPQVDPILDELSDVLADVAPMAPQVPFYSATLFDPRDRPVCDAGYWVDNLRHTVRFAAAVQAAMEDGYRVFAELAPHPLLTHAVEQTAASLDMPVAALGRHAARATAAARAAWPAGGSAQRGRRGGLLGALSRVGGWWMRRCRRGRTVACFSTRRITVRTTRITVAVHPLLGAHVRLPEEPERHAWQAEVGTAALPWLGDHQIHNVAALPGAAYCEMALAAARTVLGEGVRGPRYPLRADAAARRARPRSVAVASVDIARRRRLRRGDLPGGRAGAAGRGGAACGRRSRTSHRPTTWPRCWQRIRVDLDGAEMRQRFDERGVHYGPAFTGLAAAHAADERRSSTVLAEVALPGSIRSQQSAYGDSPRPAGCLFPVR